jgi:hypothetical protein
MQGYDYQKKITSLTNFCLLKSGQPPISEEEMGN